MSDEDCRNIVLTGFMGTGKSTVAALLAQRVRRPLVDMDRVIEQRTGYTIPQIFAEYGEAAFRVIEKGLAHELMLRQSLVIATGGGSLMDGESRDFVERHSFVVCLTANEDELAVRLGATSGRPLAPKWRELLIARRTVYSSLPHQVDTTDKAPDQVVEEIMQLWQNA